MKAKLGEVKLRDKVAKEGWVLDWKSENTGVDQGLCSVVLGDSLKVWAQ